MRTFDDALEDHRIHCMVLQCLGQPLDGSNNRADAQRSRVRTMSRQAIRLAITAAVSAMAGGAFIEVADNDYIAFRVGSSGHAKVPHTRITPPGAPRVAQAIQGGDAALAALI